MRLLAYGGTSYNQRRRLGEWPEIPQGVLQDLYGMPGDKVSFGVGILDKLPFLILRQRQNISNRDGYAYTLLLDPGEETWEQFEWNAARLYMAIKADPGGLWTLLMERPESLPADNLENLLRALKDASATGDPALESELAQGDPDRACEVWVEALALAEPAVIAPQAFGLTWRPGPEWISRVVQQFPPCFRMGLGWVVGGAGSAQGKFLGARLIIADQVPPGDVESARKLPEERTYWPAWKALRECSDISSELTHREAANVFAWPDPPREVLDRAVKLRRFLASTELAEEDYDWLQQPEQGLGPFCEDLHNTALLIARLCADHMPPAQTRFLLEAGFDRGEALSADVVNCMDIPTLDAALRQRSLAPWQVPVQIELFGTALGQVLRLMLQSSKNIPWLLQQIAIASNPWLPEKKLLDPGDLEELAGYAAELVRHRDEPLKDWHRLIGDAAIWSAVQGALREVAQTRAVSRKPGWALDYILFAGDSGGHELTDAGQAADISGVLIDALRGEYDGVIARDHLEDWVRHAASSPLRSRLHTLVKRLCAQRVSAWEPFETLTILWGGAGIVPLPAPKEQLLYLREEFHDMVAAKPQLSQPPYLDQIVKLLGGAVNPETKELLAEPRRQPPHTDADSWKAWLKGLEMIGISFGPQEPGRERTRPPADLTVQLRFHLFGITDGTGPGAAEGRKSLVELLRDWGATPTGVEALSRTFEILNRYADVFQDEQSFRLKEKYVLEPDPDGCAFASRMLAPEGRINLGELFSALDRASQARALGCLVQDDRYRPHTQQTLTSLRQKLNQGMGVDVYDLAVVQFLRENPQLQPRNPVDRMMFDDVQKRLGALQAKKFGKRNS